MTRDVFISHATEDQTTATEVCALTMRFNNLSSRFARPYDIGPDGQFIGLISADLSPTGTIVTPQIVVVQNWFEELKRRVPSK
jgi:hypothetical protein